ncbi:protein kinase, putative [Plasmodium vinckei]|uniref:Protein kinase, putative n=1 Tax=Plasmodium vinckei TaxID=5860 RepID=A0A6V7TDQ8_PLAVN|nr:protein kinase, putative [Plasmodium vinckei]
MDKTKGSTNDYPQYKLIKLIGKGTFGKVYYAIDLYTQEPVAIKRSPKWRNKVSREVDLLKKMNYSKNIVNTKSIFYTTTEKGFRIQNIVFKYMTYSLGKFIRLKKQEKRENKYERIPPESLKTIIYQICLGIKNLHEHSVAHRDLKPDNILVINKLINLYLTKHMNTKAPELLCGSMYYTTDVDLWSLGCIIFELINLCPLFPGKFKKDEYSEECSQIINLIEVLGSPNIERDLIDIINGLLKWDPNERLKIDEVLDNSYFSTLHI